MDNGITWYNHVEVSIAMVIPQYLDDFYKGKNPNIPNLKWMRTRATPMTQETSETSTCLLYSHVGRGQLELLGSQIPDEIEELSETVVQVQIIFAFGLIRLTYHIMYIYIHIIIKYQKLQKHTKAS